MIFQLKSYELILNIQRLVIFCRNDVEFSYFQPKCFFMDVDKIAYLMRKKRSKSYGFFSKCLKTIFLKERIKLKFKVF